MAQQLPLLLRSKGMSHFLSYDFRWYSSQSEYISSLLIVCFCQSQWFTTKATIKPSYSEGNTFKLLS